MNIEKKFFNKISNLKKAGNYRTFLPLERIAGKYPKAINHKNGNEVTIWCSNDYLGMGQNKEVIKAAKDTLEKTGAGAGGTRNISGTNNYIEELETELAQLHNKEKALVLTSGYNTNVTVISTIASNLSECVIFSDEKNHASMIEGIRHSKTDKIIFNHNDIVDLENKLKKVPFNLPKIIAFESIYSMDGDFGKIKEICKLAKKYNTITYLDEVHAVGLYGKNGGGVAQKLNLENDIDIIQGTLGKAFGLMGGYIASSEIMIDFIRSFAPGFIFTTTLPPALAAGATASIRFIKKNKDIRDKFHKKVRLLRKLLEENGIKIMESAEAHILPIHIGDPNKCREISNKLLEEYNIFIQHINHPTVPKGTERLRVTLTPFHTQEMIEELVRILKKLIT